LAQVLRIHTKARFQRIVDYLTELVLVSLDNSDCLKKGAVMGKYDPKAQEKVGKSMHEMHEGRLKSGNSGKKVTSQKQAVAIGLSEARKEGGKVPKKK
jgi:hypothetical protein